MSYVAPKPESYLGETVGDGECVAYVKESAGCPATSKWAEGIKVRGADIAVGTAIATFQDGKYKNVSGQSHAAIYIKQDKTGLTVYDQWAGQPVHERPISFKGGNGKPSSDGDAFAVIESLSVMLSLEKIQAKKASGAGAEVSTVKGKLKGEKRESSKAKG